MSPPPTPPSGWYGEWNAIPILYYTMLYYAILYHTILYYTILYYTIEWNGNIDEADPAAARGAAPGALGTLYMYSIIYMDEYNLQDRT